MSGGAVALTLVVAFFCYAPVAIYQDVKKSRRESKEAEDKAKAWLADEKLKPRFQVVVEDKDGVRYTSEPLEPRAEYMGGWFGWRKETSRDLALDAASRCIAHGFHNRRDGFFIPAGRIKVAHASEVR